MRALAILLLVACTAADGPGRFAGTYTARGLTGYTTLRLFADGRAESIASASEGGAEPRSDLSRGSFSVLGDTAFVRMDLDDGASTLRFLLRGDSLVMLDRVLGERVTFVRQE